MIINFVFDDIVNGLPVNNIFNIKDIGYPELWRVPYHSEWATQVYYQLFMYDKSDITKHSIICMKTEEFENYEHVADLNIYPICCLTTSFRYPWQLDLLPRKIVDLVNQNKIKIMLFNLFEASYYNMENFKEGLHLVCKRQKIQQTNNIIIACTDVFLEQKWKDAKSLFPEVPQPVCKNLNGYGPETLRRIIKYNYYDKNKDFLEIYSSTPHKDYTFLFLNNRNTSIRYVMYKFLEFDDVLKHGMISWNHPDHLNNYMQGETFVLIGTTAGTIKNPTFIEKLKSSPEILENKMHNDRPFKYNDPYGSGLFMHEDWIRNSYFSVLSETHVGTVSSQITEKIYKLFYYCHPFIVFGPPGFLAMLHKLGYKTFPEIFDESYDNMDNTFEKFKHISDQIAFYTLPEGRAQLIEKMPLIKETLKHNRNRFMTQDYHDLWAGFKD
jgi:hypothetical protein